MTSEKTATDFLSRAAGWWGKQPELTQRLMLGAGAFATTLAANEGYKAVSNALSKSRGFSSMIDANPQIAKMDRSRVQQLYGTLHHLSPTMATDPLIAGSWVKRMSGMEEYIDPKTVLDIAKAEEALSSPKVQPGMDPYVHDVFQGIASGKSPSNPFLVREPKPARNP